MSSILKALRKVEEEKSRGPEGTPDIARDILKSGPRRYANPWMTYASVAVLVVASGLTGYFLMMGKPEFPALPPEVPQAVQMPPANVSAPAESVSVQAGSHPAPPPTLSPEPAPSKTSRPKPPPEPAAKKSKTRVSSGPALSRPQEPAKAARSGGSAQNKGAAEPLPALTLTGIAFQEDREGRLAVINNLPVMEGTVIAGARVMEISEDRVLLNYSGRNFEVLLDGPSQVK